MNQDYYDIPFLDVHAKLEPILDRYSSAQVFKLLQHGQCYFLKIQPYHTFDEDRITNIVNAYASIVHNQLNIIDCGITRDQKLWVVYNWIEGRSLKQLYACEGHDFYQYGYEIGNAYKVFNEHFFDESLKVDHDFFELAHSIQDEFEHLYQTQDIFSKNFLDSHVSLLHRKFLDILPTFKKTKKEFIHGDLHPKNIMLDQNGHLVIIDCDSFLYDYLVVNFRWSFASIYKYQENKQFFKGFIDGRYPNDKPKYLYEQLLFILILKFYEQTVSYYKKEQWKELCDYFLKFSVIIEQIPWDQKDYNILD